MSKGVQIAGGATVIALLLGWYAASNLDEEASFAYYQNLAEFQAAPQADAGSPVRVHGYVALESIERDVAGRQVHFTVVNDPPHGGGNPGAGLRVVYTSLETPDLFKDGAEVVIEGFVADSVFEADKVMAKCPSKFAAEAGQPPPG